jgi:hypothetical protein
MTARLSRRIAEQRVTARLSWRIAEQRMTARDLRAVGLVSIALSSAWSVAS